MQPTVTDLLQKYLPLPAVEPIRSLIDKYQVDLTITRDRKTKRGDFRPGINGRRHHITINGSLNKYEFLLVALHELAHVHVFNKHARRAAPHGKEWKETFGAFIRNAVNKELFDPALSLLLNEYSYKIKASGISDVELTKAMQAYDEGSDSHCWQFLDELPDGGVFETKSKRQYVKAGKMRKRYRCICMTTNREYAFNPVAQVRHIDKSD